MQTVLKTLEEPILKSVSSAAVYPFGAVHTPSQSPNLPVCKLNEGLSISSLPTLQARAHPWREHVRGEGRKRLMEGWQMDGHKAPVLSAVDSPLG